MDSAIPDFFERFPMQRVRADALDEAIATAAEPLVLLFLWGRDCVNCDVAKRAIMDAPERFRWPDVRWLHDNVYEDPAMAHRFGLHGVPAFVLFRAGRRVGRITSWPGADAFRAAIEARRGGGAAPP